MKAMKFSRIKNFLIVGLVFVAVYQTGKLWLGNYSGHNFFYSIVNTTIGGQKGKNTLAEVMDAKKIVVGYGNKSFSLIYPGLFGSNDVLAKTNDFISEVLINGEYVETQDTAMDEYISQKCVVYDFAFNVSATQYFFGIGDVKDEAVKGIDAINQIVAVPSAGKNDVSYLYIVDAEAGKTNIFKADAVYESEKLYALIKENEEANADKIKYISTQQSGFNIFKENTFVPQWTQSGYQYAPINKVNAFRYTKDDILEVLESGTEGFFGNYSTKTLSKDTNGVYMISDDSTVVKFYPLGTLEYYNYDDTVGKTEQTLSTAYYECKQFLKKDDSLKTRLFLSDVQLKSDGLVFCFDYCVNGIPVFLSKEVNESLSIEHAAEVVVQNNTVKKYKRYAYNFELSTMRDKMVEVDFLGAMNQVIATASSEATVTEIEDIELGYYVDDSEKASLKWFAYVEDKTYMVDTVSNKEPKDMAEDEQ